MRHASSVFCLQDGEKFLSETLGRLNIATDAASAVTEVDLVIEAIVENLDIKTKLFTSLDAAAPQ